MKHTDRYQQLMQELPAYISSFLPDGTITFVNSALAIMAGRRADELVGRCMFDLLNAEEREFIQFRLNSLTPQTPVESHEQSYIGPDGSLLRQHWTNKALFDAAGNVVEFLAMGLDITERKQVEYLSEEKFSKLFYINPSACGLTDLETGKYLEVNQAFYKLFGFDQDEVIGRTPTELGIITDDAVQAILKLAYAENRMTNMDADLKAKNGVIKHVLLSAEDIYVQDKKLRYTVVQDITDLKHVENALRESEEKYRGIFDESITSIYVFDNNKRFVNSNQAGLDLLGYSRQELLSMSIPDVDVDPVVVLPAHQQLLTGDRLINYEHRLRRKDGTIITVSNNSKPLTDHQGNIIGMLSTLIDISERKHDERLLQEQSVQIQAQNEELNRTNIELREAKKRAEEADRLKSAFLANMSHEIRTPMNGILGFAELLKEPNLTGESMHNYIAMIEKSGARMLNIINDIVDISKIESGQVEVVVSRSNINEQLQYICDFFRPEAKRKAITLTHSFGLPSRQAVIRTDREKLYAILTNLVKNAIKYTDTGCIEVTYAKKTRGLEFCIKDTGIGISRDLHQSIFNRFVQADMSDQRAFQGAGLGLAITKAYVEMLGGTIWVESEPGRGSRFYFTLPYRPVSESYGFSLPSPDQQPEVTLAKTLKILIVEDDDVSAKLLAMAIEKLQNDLLRAVTGAEAVELSRNHPDIDIILMDLKLPTMDGYETVRRIRQFNPNVIIIAQTAYGLHGDREKAIQVGCDDYIAKPIRKKELLAMIEKYCR
jgi:PAS domain S-box-containing protein